MILEQLLKLHILDPKNPEKIFNLAYEYDTLDQGAAAISLYLKAADLEENDRQLQYKCLTRSAMCYDRQGDRGFSVLGLLQHAVGLMLDNPEAHYILAKHYASVKDWRNCFINANYALRYIDKTNSDIMNLNKNDVLYYINLAEFNTSGNEESKIVLFNLMYGDIEPEHKQSIIEVLNFFYPDTIPYIKEFHKEAYKYPFKGMDIIERNHSKHFQDMFVLSILQGKRNGSYVEIGSGHPTVHSNTYLLEDKFDWKGISIDLDKELCHLFKQKRNNTVLSKSALNIEYEELFDEHCLGSNIDYLQIDIDELSFEVLKLIPFHKHKFATITFEHDGFEGNELRKNSRELLEKAGYILVGKNIAYNPQREYEDWYVHPDLVNKRVMSGMMTSDRINFVWDYMIDQDKL